MQTFLTIKLRVEDSDLAALKEKVRQVFGPTLTSLEWFEEKPLEPLQRKSGGPLLPSKAPDSLAAVLAEYNVTLPLNYAKWKIAWRPLDPMPSGEIVGLPGLRGKIIATDGVKAILVRPDGKWSYVHNDSFKADKESPALPFTGKPRAERQSPQQLALAEYV